MGLFHDEKNMNLFTIANVYKRKVFYMEVYDMNPETIMLVVTLIIGFALFFMVITRKGTFIKALCLWLIQLIVILSINIFSLNLGVIDTFTSTFGLITMLMLILVLTNKKERR